MNIEIWSVGKSSESFIEEGVRYYIQKTRPYSAVELVVLQPGRKAQTKDIVQAKKMEGEMILKRLLPQHVLILLDERGKQLSSPQWAQQIEQMREQGCRTLVLLIGGAYGVANEVRERARQTWSLSSLVFPHQLVRLIVAEQVYRSFSILHNSPYHHS